MVGHSGTGPEAEQLVQWGEPPQGEAKRLQLLQRSTPAPAPLCPRPLPPRL